MALKAAISDLVQRITFGLDATEAVKYDFFDLPSGNIFKKLIFFIKKWWSR